MSEQVIKAVQEHAEAVNAFKGDVTKQLDEVRSLYTGLSDAFIDLAQKSAGSSAFHSNKPASVADSFMKSDQMAAMLKGAPSTGRVSIQGIKSVMDNTTYDAQPQRDNSLSNNPQRRLSLLDVLPSMRVTSGTFEFVQLSGYTNAAAVQITQGSAKAEAAIDTAVQTANIATIAHWTRASLQILSDAPALQKQIDNLLKYGVQAKLENELINGAGGTGKISGLMAQATVFTPTKVFPADKIGEAKTAMESAGWMPSVILMNPNDWFSVASERADVGGNGQYVMGSPRDPASASLWSTQVVTTPSLAAGTALVLDAQQVSILAREDVTVMASREDGSNWTNNLVTILAELRAGLAVFAPGAVLKVAL